MKNPTAPAAATMGATYSGKLNWSLEKKKVTYEDLVDIINDAMDNVDDMDTNFDGYAQAVAEALIKEELVEVIDGSPK